MSRQKGFDEIAAYATSKGCKVVTGSKHTKVLSPRGGIIFVMSRGREMYDVPKLKRQIDRNAI